MTNRWIGRPSGGLALALAAVLALLVAPALAQEPSCPPSANNPRCTGEDTPGGGQTPGNDDTPGGDAPGTDGGAAEDDGEPTSPDSSASPTGQSPGSPPDPAPEGPTVAPPADEDGPVAQAPPPPDLGPVRVLTTRLLPRADRSSLEVVVDERRAGGVDGGWLVTVDVDAATLGSPRASLDPGSPQPGVPRPGHARARPDSATLFTVVGQRSEQRYHASYRGTIMVEGEPDGPRPTVTVTLFQ